MRGFSSICAILVALLGASSARAADPSSNQASTAAPVIRTSDPTSTDQIRHVVSGLRQSLADNGLSQALTRTGDWVKELEVTWTVHLHGRASIDINTQPEPETGLDAIGLDAMPGSAAVAAKPVVFASHGNSLNLGLVSFGTSDADDQVWIIGHARPLASLTTGTTEHDGSTTSERSLASHDFELDLRMPMLPWNATVAGDRYWWGVQSFGPQVQGTRVALKLSPMQNIEIEGGRASDTRGNGGFVGLRYSVPLDQPQ